MSALSARDETLPQQPDASRIRSATESAFGDRKDQDFEKLQGEIDAITARAVIASFEPFRDGAEELLRTLRLAFGQLARFVEGDFREQASFYLGQLHALGEMAERVRQRRLPKDAVALVTSKESSIRILRTVVDRGSIGASDLASKVGMQESNLSTLCKELCGRELLRADRFGKRVRYSPTPLTHAVLTHLREDQTAPRVAAPVTASTAPDLSKTMATAAAASLHPGNVMANTNDFVSGLFALGGLRGADAIVIDPIGNEIRIEGKKSEKGAHLLPPESIRESLTQQTRGLSMLEGSFDSVPGQDVFDWRGQRVRVAVEQTPLGKKLRLEFIDNPVASETKERVQIAFREIEDEKSRLEDFRKFYVREVLETCGGLFGEAAKTLGIQPPELRSILK